MTTNITWQQIKLYLHSTTLLCPKVGLFKLGVHLLWVHAWYSKIIFRKLCALCLHLYICLSSTPYINLRTVKVLVKDKFLFWAEHQAELLSTDFEPGFPINAFCRFTTEKHHSRSCRLPGNAYLFVLKVGMTRTWVLIQSKALLR